MKLQKKSQSFLFYWIIFLVAIEVLFLFFVIPTFTQFFPDLYNINRFPDGYDKLASNLTAGNGYKFFSDASDTIMRTPAYPLLLAMIFYFFPHSLIAVKILNLVLTLATAWMIMNIVRHFSNSEIALMVATSSFLLHPAIILAQSRGGVESLFCFSTTAFIFTLCKAFESKKMIDFIVAGLLLGLATTVKSTTILFPIFLFGCLLLTRKWNLIVTLWMPRLVIMGSVMLVILLPWIVRNYLLVHQFVPTMTVAGTAAFDGLYACRNYSLNVDANTLHHEASELREEIVSRLDLPHRPSGYFQYFYKAQDELAFNQYLLNLVFSEYRHTPELLLQCSLLNGFNFWFGGRMLLSTFLNMLVQVPYLILAALGIYFCVKNGHAKQLFPIVVFAAYFFILHLPVNGIARYSVPLIPFLAVFFGVALDEMRRKYLTNQSPRFKM